MAPMVAALEQQLLELAEAGEGARIQGPIFIVAAPRTGSTIFFQTMVEAFCLPYIANLTNTYFPHTPILGLSMQAAWPIYGAISGDSKFGKTDGLLQPCEASGVMEHWFGGGHPSEVVSHSVLPGREAHMQATVRAAWCLFKRPLVVKNAWNCFRIRDLARALPAAAFVWIRRDITASAMSDLDARYRVQGMPEAWNSATPRNVDELLRRPYWEQVVENQFEFARAIGEACRGLPPPQFAELWYEDFIERPFEVLRTLAKRLVLLSSYNPERLPLVRPGDTKQPALRTADAVKIKDYLAAHAERLSPLRYATSNVAE